VVEAAGIGDLHQEVYNSLIYEVYPARPWLVWDTNLVSTLSDPSAL
jgi:hypothetical protein